MLAIGGNIEGHILLSAQIQRSIGLLSEGGDSYNPEWLTCSH